MNIQWQWHTWRDLTPGVLHAFLKLRSDIFVVEQNCVYADMDGLDDRCEHLCAFDSGELVTYLRLLPPGLKSKEAALGRLVVKHSHRRKGFSRDAIERGLARCAELYPQQPVFAQAQAHLAAFYQTLGFSKISEEYMEDGIAHIDMRR